MIGWLTAPEFLSDAELVREYKARLLDDDRAAALLAQIKRRGLRA